MTSDSNHSGPGRPVPQPVLVRQVEDYYSAATGAAFAAASAARARDPHQLSISQIGRCLRQSAFKLAGTPVDEGWNDIHHRSAELGTWLHEHFVPELAAALEHAAAEADADADRQRTALAEGDDTVTVEQPVVLRAAGIEIPGTYDLYQPAAPHGPTLLDAKSAGEWRWRSVLGAASPEEYQWQSKGYATALVQDGRAVEWLVWLYLRRDNGDDLPKAEPFAPDDALDVIRRVGRIVDAAEAPTDPVRAPREGPGPSSALKRSWSPCDSCAWLRRCWGPGAGTAAPQAAAATERPTGAAAAALAHLRHSTAKAAAADAMAFTRAVLTGVPDGFYPDPEDERVGALVKRRSNGALVVTAAKAPTPPPTLPPDQDPQQRQARMRAWEETVALIVACTTD